MRRLLLILGLLCAAVAIPLSAQATTTVEQVTFEETFPLCNGDPIHISGTLLSTTTETTTPSGGHVFAFHFNPQGVTGVDLVTGTVFHATGLTRDLVVESPAGGTTETFVNLFHIQATGGEESFIGTDFFHITITPDGTVRVEVEMHSSTC
jgi:hypothetical protein